MRMDEIFIEEKKYVSSKRAAKITGYAKDYIGQLCREGRVPARLVGRGWYVLESAIQDHRFGNQDDKAKAVVQTVTPAVPVTKTVPEAWGFPRYEASHTEVLPSIRRLREIEDDQGEEVQATQDIHESWRAWFDHVASTATTTETPALPVVEAPVSPAEKSVAIPKREIEEDVIHIPLRVMNRLEEPIELPRVPTEPQELATPKKVRTRGGNVVGRSIQMLGVALASVSLALVCLASGYFDRYIISYNQISIISGVSVYDK